MTLQWKWLYAARIGSALVVAAISALACQDVITDTPHAADAAVTTALSSIPRNNLSLREARARDRRGPKAQRFHRRNRMSWVGEAHNAGIEAYLADKRGRKFSSSNLCKDVVDYFDTADVYPRHAPQPSRSQRRAAHRLGVRVVPCGRAFADASPVVFNTALPLERPQEFTVSAEAAAMMAEIGTALDAAPNPEALAGSLELVLDQAQMLPPDQADAVAAVASVTQSSFEYWNANYETVAAEIAQQLRAANDECLSNGNPSACLANTALSGSVVDFAALTPLPGCLDALASGKEIARADFAGAFAGALFGGWASAGLSILGGGVTASAGMMLWNVAVNVFCWFMT